MVIATKRGAQLSKLCEVCYGGCSRSDGPGNFNAVVWLCCDGMECCWKCHQMGLPELHDE